VAADVTETVVTPAAAAPAPAQAPEKTPRRPYRFRFALLYLGLAAAVAGAGVGAWFAFSGGSDGDQEAVSTVWSAWRPTAEDPTQAASQIANHVASQYKLPTGQQLVKVIAGKPDVTQVPVGGLIVQNQLGFAIEATQLRASDTIMFILCGAGPDCSIQPGKPSLARGRLVRRETLELALQTFKHVSGVDKVIAIQPTSSATTERLLVYLTKSDVSQQLNVPLERTLSAETPLQNAIPQREVATIDRLVGSHLFDFSVQQAAQGDAILVLKQPAA
jgi:hypothetical protein